MILSSTRARLHTKVEIKDPSTWLYPTVLTLCAKITAGPQTPNHWSMALSRLCAAILLTAGVFAESSVSSVAQSSVAAAWTTACGAALILVTALAAAVFISVSSQNLTAGVHLKPSATLTGVHGRHQSPSRRVTQLELDNSLSKEEEELDKSEERLLAALGWSGEADDNEAFAISEADIAAFRANQRCESKDGPRVRYKDRMEATQMSDIIKRWQRDPEMEHECARQPTPPSTRRTSQCRQEQVANGSPSQTKNRKGKGKQSKSGKAQHKSSPLGA